MRRPGDDLLLVAGVSILLAPLALLTSGTPRTAVGVAFALAVPGYALVCALFPRRSSLGVVERLALGLGLSFAAVALIGLGLNYTPWGIRLTPVLISLVAFSLAMAAVAWLRRGRLAVGERFSPRLASVLTPLIGSWAGQPRFSKALTALVALVVVGAAGTAAYAVAKPNPGERFSEFYILDGGGRTQDYPRELMLGESASVALGIVNREYQITTYRVDIIAGGVKVKEVGPIELRHDETLEQAVDFTPERPGQRQEVDFYLYKGDGSDPYRSLRLWIDVKGGP